MFHLRLFAGIFAIFVASNMCVSGSQLSNGHSVQLTSREKIWLWYAFDGLQPKDDGSASMTATILGQIVTESVGCFELSGGINDLTAGTESRIQDIRNTFENGPKEREVLDVKMADIYRNLKRIVTNAGGCERRVFERIKKHVARLDNIMDNIKHCLEKGGFVPPPNPQSVDLSGELNAMLQN